MGEVFGKRVTHSHKIILGIPLTVAVSILTYVYRKDVVEESTFCPADK